MAALFLQLGGRGGKLHALGGDFAAQGGEHHKLVRDINDPNGEPAEYMAKAALLLATEPLDKVSGRVTYSQVLLKEYGIIDEAKGIGTQMQGTGYSRI